MLLGEADLQCVPDHFESVEEYVRVFEPLLFEECRAQLYSTWEESTETISRDITVRVKNIERRERGTKSCRAFFNVVTMYAQLFLYLSKDQITLVVNQFTDNFNCLFISPPYGSVTILLFSIAYYCHCGIIVFGLPSFFCPLC